MSKDDVQRARDNFVAWINWYLQAYAKEVPSQAEMARRMGVQNATLTYLRQVGSTRVPDFRTILGARRVIGFPIDALLFSPPPAKPA